MDEQEFLEAMEYRRGEAADRIYGLLSGTNDEDDNIIQILDSLILQAFGRAFIIGATEQRQGRVEFLSVTDKGKELFDQEGDTLGPCGCTDYHMADCPLMTDR